MKYSRPVRQGPSRLFAACFASITEVGQRLVQALAVALFLLLLRQSSQLNDCVLVRGREQEIHRSPHFAAFESLFRALLALPVCSEI